MHPSLVGWLASLVSLQADGASCEKPHLRLAKTDIWVPDVEAYARYSYPENVPFLAGPPLTTALDPAVPEFRRLDPHSEWIIQRGKLRMSVAVAPSNLFCNRTLACALLSRNGLISE
jgi:hypothetical protein